MAIEVHCSHCQKLLRVKAELAGKRVKCPACGQPLTIPLPERPSSADLPPQFPPTAPQNQNELWQWIESSEPGIPLAKQESHEATGQPVTAPNVEPSRLQRRSIAKEKPRSSAKRERFTFSLFGQTFTLVSFIIPLAIIGSLIGGVLYWFGTFDSKFRIAEIQRVESYVAYHLGYQELGPVIGGPDRLFILRKSDEGGYLLIRIVIRQSWITDMRPPQIMNALSLKDEDFALRVGDTEEHPLLVINELPKEPRKVEYSFSHRISQDETTPHPEDSWGQSGIVDLSNVHVQMGINGVQSCSGTAIYTSAKGMRVQFDFSGRSVAVSWEPGCLAMVGSNRWDASRDMFTVNTQLNCLFRRPTQAGPASLSLFGQAI